MRIVLSLVLVLCVQGLFAQTPDLPEFSITANEVEAQIRFLASDELKGRDTGSEGNLIAARYIAAQLEAYGFESPEGAEEYFQWVPFEKVSPPSASSLKLHKDEFEFGEDYLLLSGAAIDTKTTAVYAGHGWVDAESGHDDYAGLDVKGKVVIVAAGTPDSKEPRTVFRSMRIKRELAQERGAAALIELYTLQFPWEFFKRYFGGSNISLAEEDRAMPPMPYGWIKDISKTDVWKRLRDEKKTKIAISSSGTQREMFYSPNVIGVLEGTDPELKNEYILLSAHFDHVGVGKAGSNATTPEDSIFNGARDNAMGTIAMLSAAKSLGIERPKRSVIAMGFTGEEKGLLGSSYYVDHPLFPLDETIYNLNADGAGYNSTEHIAVFGYGRTGTDAFINQTAELVDLEVLQDPVPEQGIFDRSDNVSFAAKGVPSLSVSPGTTAFDAEVQQYYHQVTDEADNVDMDYLQQYAQYVAHLARLIANMDGTPFWIEGDKYEEAGRTLYER